MTIKQMQCLLAYLGYYAGNIDGIWGTLSKTATVAFQKDFGITDTGIVGTETEKALKHAVVYGMPACEPQEEPESGDFWDEIEFFKREEFACKCGKCGGFPVEPDEKLVRLLDAIRKHYGVAISPSSGIRCEAHNKAVGGATYSQHLYGKAADISVPGVSPEDLYAYAETLLPDTGGLGIYKWGIHIDTRTTKSRWDGR